MAAGSRSSRYAQMVPRSLGLPAPPSHFATTSVSRLNSSGFAFSANAPRGSVNSIMGIARLLPEVPPPGAAGRTSYHAGDQAMLTEQTRMSEPAVGIATAADRVASVAPVTVS